ncbi:UBP1-associated protein 2C [Nymphaea thermarum]|nr:UBP1-associated protein 2C [Nymphaea thermarum]
MEATKKRKAEENGTVDLSVEDARKILEPFTQEQLIDILQDATVKHPDVLDAVRAIADRDTTQRKLFIRGLGWDTTTDGLRTIFSAYGQLEEAVVILDKATGKSKGYGFITFKHIDGAINALKEPSKKIDGRMTVTQLAAAGNQPSAAAADVSTRKIFIGNVPNDMPADRLLAHFLQYGEIEEGPLGYDKQTGKSRGYALFVYKTADAAKASLVEPTKVIDGHQLLCKLAVEGKKGKPGPGGVPEGMPEVPPVGMGVNPVPGNPGGMQYGGVAGYGGLSGHPSHPPPSAIAAGHHTLNSSLPSSVNPSLSGVSGQVPSSLGSSYGSALGAGGYGGSQYGASQYGGPGAGGYGGIGGASSLYRMPPTSVGGAGGGPAAGVYPESGPYGLSSASSYPSQHHQPSGTSPVPRVPSGGMYQSSMPPYY